MKKEIDNDKPIERKVYIPPADHPWRKDMMLRKKLNTAWDSVPNPEV